MNTIKEALAQATYNPKLEMSHGSVSASGGIIYSYRTAVAVVASAGVLVSSENVSVTTSKHIGIITRAAGSCCERIAIADLTGLVRLFERAQCKMSMKTPIAIVRGEMIQEIVTGCPTPDHQESEWGDYLTPGQFEILADHAGLSPKVTYAGLDKQSKKEIRKENAWKIEKVSNNCDRLLCKYNAMDSLQKVSRLELNHLHTRIKYAKSSIKTREPVSKKFTKKLKLVQAQITAELKQRHLRETRQRCRKQSHELTRIMLHMLRTPSLDREVNASITAYKLVAAMPRHFLESKIGDLHQLQARDSGKDVRDKVFEMSKYILDIKKHLVLAGMESAEIDILSVPLETTITNGYELPKHPEQVRMALLSFESKVLLNRDILIRIFTETGTRLKWNAERLGDEPVMVYLDPMKYRFVTNQYGEISVSNGILLAECAIDIVENYGTDPVRIDRKFGGYTLESKNRNNVFKIGCHRVDLNTLRMARLVGKRFLSTVTDNPSS